MIPTEYPQWMVSATKRAQALRLAVDCATRGEDPYVTTVRANQFLTYINGHEGARDPD